MSISYLSNSTECPKLLQQDKEQDNVIDEYSYSNLENKQQCTCMDNHMNNIVRLNGDLTHKIGFHEFPGNYLTTSILEMFSNYAANWKNK
jgi:hypothetical protein